MRNSNVSDNTNLLVVYPVIKKSPYDNEIYLFIIEVKNKKNENKNGEIETLDLFEVDPFNKSILKYLSLKILYDDLKVGFPSVISFTDLLTKFVLLNKDYLDILDSSNHSSDITKPKNKSKNKIDLKSDLDINYLDNLNIFSLFISKIYNELFFDIYPVLLETNRNLKLLEQKISKWETFFKTKYIYNSYKVQSKCFSSLRRLIINNILTKEQREKLIKESENGYYYVPLSKFIPKKYLKDLKITDDIFDYEKFVNLVLDILKNNKKHNKHNTLSLKFEKDNIKISLYNSRDNTLEDYKLKVSVYEIDPFREQLINYKNCLDENFKRLKSKLKQN